MEILEFDSVSITAINFGMPIYDKPVRSILPDMITDLVSQAGQVFSRDAAISWFRDRFPKIKEGTIIAHLRRFSTNDPGRLHHGFRSDEDLLFKIDASHFRRYDPLHDPAPIHSEADVSNALTPNINSITADTPGDCPSGTASEFAYELDLQRFLAKNLSLLEPGLKLYEEEGISGREFPVGGRYIDILAVDAQNRFVVIELKVSRGYDRVVGQLLRYVAWIREHHADPGQQVRGIIIAREISEDLRLACSSLNSVALYEYELSVKLKKIDS